MAATRILDGNYREVWRETVGADFDGGDVVVVQTKIRVPAGQIGRVRAELRLDTEVGLPVVPDPVLSVVNGLLVVTVQNTAGAGNQATWTLDVWFVVSDQQGRDDAAPGLAWTSRPGTPGLPGPHAVTHQNGGTDEINVGGLSGVLADPQVPVLHGATHGYGGSDPIPVPSGTLRLYVDGTLGNDAAAGTSWGTAWKTLAKLQSELTLLASFGPSALTVFCFLRGVFSTENFSHTQEMGGMLVHFIHPISEWSNVYPAGTIYAVGGEAPAPQHGLTRVALAGIALTTDALGRVLVIEDATATRRHSTQIVRIDAVNSYVWTIQNSSSVMPAWVNSTCTARVVAPTITGINFWNQSANPSIALTGGSPRSFILGVVAERFSFNGVPSAFAVYSTSSAADGIYIEGGSWKASSSFRIAATSSAADKTVAVEAGLATATDTTCYVGSSSVSQVVTYQAYAIWTGYFASGVLFSNGSAGSFSDGSAAFVDAEASNYSTFKVILRGSTATLPPIRANHASEAVVGNVSFLDLPATGVTEGLVCSRHNSNIRLDSSVEGINSGSSAGLVAIKIYDQGRIQITGDLAGKLRGDDGFADVVDGNLSCAAQTLPAFQGDGPDVRIGEGGSLYLSGALTKSAVNTVASAVLEVLRGGRVAQASGQAFTLATPAVDWGSSYGANGAIYLHEAAEAVLGTLSGGAAGTTGAGAKVKNGSKLLHGGTGLAGVAPLDLGGLPAPIPWPAGPVDDAGAPTPQGCLVIQGV